MVENPKKLLRVLAPFRRSLLDLTPSTNNWGRIEGDPTLLTGDPLQRPYRY